MCESGSSIMTRVLVHLVLHCVFSTRRATEGHTLRVRMHACAICHCMQCTSTMCKSGNSTYFTTPRCECTERTSARSPRKRTFMAHLWHGRGQRSNSGGSRGQTQHDQHSVPYLAQRSKVKKCTRTCPALTTHSNPACTHLDLNRVLRN